MASSDQIIAAQQDEDLKARAVALGAKHGYLPYEVEARFPQIAVAQIGETTIADVHAYAVATYTPTPRPGANLAAVTDVQLEEALIATMAPAPVVVVEAE